MDWRTVYMMAYRYIHLGYVSRDICSGGYVAVSAALDNIHDQCIQQTYTIHDI